MLPFSAYCQDCLKKENYKVHSIAPCENRVGEISIELFAINFDLVDKNVALYRPDLIDFERNRISNKGVTVEGNKLVFKGIAGGLYQVAIYIYDCSEFPKPVLIPEEPLEIYYSKECE